MIASVVIPTYRRPKTLRETVEAVCDQTVSDFEVIVVDDGSNTDEQDAVLDEIQRRHGRVRVLRQENAGPAAARNRGWRAAESDTILFTDDDCLPPREWTERLTEAFEPRVGAVGGTLIPTADAERRSVFARLHRYRNEEIYSRPDEPTVGDENLPMGGTANIAYRRETLEAVDGFDTSFPTAAGEDADLQKRVADTGYEMKFVPVAVEHNDAYDWESFKSRAIRHGKGAFYYKRVHGTPRPVWRIGLGFLGAPFSGVDALRRTGDPTTALFVTLEHVLYRAGEYVATRSGEARKDE